MTEPIKYIGGFDPATGEDVAAEAIFSVEKERVTLKSMAYVEKSRSWGKKHATEQLLQSKCPEPIILGPETDLEELNRVPGVSVSLETRGIETMGRGLRHRITICIDESAIRSGLVKVEESFFETMRAQGKIVGAEKNTRSPRRYTISTITITITDPDFE